MSYKRNGFTLIELLVVIAIIGILSTIAMTSLNDARIKARDARRRSDLEQMVLAMDQYYAQHGTYVVSGSGWNGSGQGWFNYQSGSGTSYSKSIANGLQEAGYFSTAPRDPQITSDTQASNGNARQYMFYICGTGYFFYAHLEAPTPTDTAVFNTTCGKGGSIETTYKMNYAAGRR